MPPNSTALREAPYCIHVQSWPRNALLGFAALHEAWPLPAGARRPQTLPAHPLCTQDSLPVHLNSSNELAGLL